MKKNEEESMTTEETGETTLESIIASFENEELAQEVVAERVVDALLAEHPGEARRMLIAPIAEQIRRLRRRHVAEVEYAAARAVDPLAERKELLAERFWAPGFGYVLWGDATEEQHAARAEYLRNQAESLMSGADRHDEAIREIRSAGVKCLNQVDRQRKAKAA